MIHVRAPWALGIFFAACGTAPSTGDPGAPDPAITFPVTELTRRDTTFTILYVADIQAHKNVEVHARVNGAIRKIHVDEGQLVKQGQLLFEITDDELRIDLEQANAALLEAQAQCRVAGVEMERVAQLVERNVVSATEKDLARAKHAALEAGVERAKAAAADARLLLSYTRVHAPFNGIIDRLPLKEGTYVSERSLLTTISDINSVYAYFNLSESEYLSLMSNGASEEERGHVHLELANGELYPYPGRLAAASSEMDEHTGSIAFRAHFPNPDNLLRHGATGKILIQRKLKNVLLVPQRSVMEIQDHAFVYRLEKGNRVKLDRFDVSGRLGPYFIVKDGLKESDTIVLEGVQNISDGDSIVPIKGSIAG